MPVYNAETGELMKELPAPLSRRLRRKKWVELLSKDIEIRVCPCPLHNSVQRNTLTPRATQRGMTLSEIRNDGDSVTAIFTDGTRETGDLLVGAEGAHSLTREYLLGKDAAQLLPSNVVASFSLTQLDRDISLGLRNLHPRYCVLFHPNGTFAFHSSKPSRVRLPRLSLAPAF